MKNIKKYTPISSTSNKNYLGQDIKLGIDVHIDSYVVVMKIDGSVPLRPRRFQPKDFLPWVGRLKGRCGKIYSCYEAGAFGYVLHRKLADAGVTNYVIRPVSWDEYGQRVKTDGRDATQMVLCLDGYLRGNQRSFSTVRVPTEEEEQLRSVTRQRTSLIKERKRIAAQGRGCLMYYGGRLRGQWWKPRKWEALKGELSDFLVALLRPLRSLLVAIEEQIKQVEMGLEQMKRVALPVGMGTVIFQQLEREACDWNRFGNRKQIGSYTGLCPCEDSSASRRFQGSISKHGNPRMRHMLIECVWLLMRWNPGYRGFDKWYDKLMDFKATRSSRKKIVVAIARQFAVDWWMVRTGRIKPEELGLKMKALSV